MVWTTSGDDVQEEAGEGAPRRRWCYGMPWVARVFEGPEDVAGLRVYQRAAGVQFLQCRAEGNGAGGHTQYVRCYTGK